MSDISTITVKAYFELTFYSLNSLYRVVLLAAITLNK